MPSTSEPLLSGHCFSDEIRYVPGRSCRFRFFKLSAPVRSAIFLAIRFASLHLISPSTPLFSVSFKLSDPLCSIAVVSYQVQAYQIVSFLFRFFKLSDPLVSSHFVSGTLRSFLIRSVSSNYQIRAVNIRYGHCTSRPRTSFE